MTYKHTPGEHFEQHVQRERKSPRAEDIDKAIKPSGKVQRQQSNGHADQEPLVLRRASDVEPENIRWLWRHFLARRKLHLIAGAPGTAKSTISLTWAAILS